MTRTNRPSRHWGHGLWPWDWGRDVAFNGHTEGATPLGRRGAPQAWGVLSVLPLLLVAGCTRGPGRSSSRTFEFRYTASLANLPTHAKQVRIWIPLAKTRENQQVLTRQARTSFPYDIHEEPVYGNDILYLALSPPIPQPVDVVVDYAVTVHSGRPLDSRQLFHASEAVASADESLGSASPRSPRAERARREAGRPPDASGATSRARAPGQLVPSEVEGGWGPRRGVEACP